MKEVRFGKPDGADEVPALEPLPGPVLQIDLLGRAGSCCDEEGIPAPDDLDVSFHASAS